MPTCSQSVWLDRTVVPFGQRDDDDSVNCMLLLSEFELTIEFVVSDEVEAVLYVHTAKNSVVSAKLS